MKTQGVYEQPVDFNVIARSMGSGSENGTVSSAPTRALKMSQSSTTAVAIKQLLMTAIQLSSTMATLVLDPRNKQRTLGIRRS